MSVLPQDVAGISDDYIESIGEWLIEWRDEPDSWILAQFLRRYDIGWSYLQYFVKVSPRLKNIFETTIATLCEKWLMYAMKAEKLPAHMQKVVMKYLRVYDNHAFSVEKEAREAVAAEAARAAANPEGYEREDYSKEELNGLYSDIYERNVNKSRD